MFFNRSRLAAIAVAVSIALPVPAVAQSGSGAYLAGRQALFSSDFSAAATYYSRALTRDRNNPKLMENVVLSQLALGRLDRAEPVAELMAAQGIQSQFAHMVILANLVADQDYAHLLERIDDLEISALVDGLIKAWAKMATGDREAALAEFDAVSRENGLRTFALYHKALALASIGEYAASEEIFAGEQGGLSRMSRRAAIARAEILSQLGRNEHALDILNDAFNQNFDPSLTAVADRLAAGEKLPTTHVTTPLEGLAEVFFSIAQALNGEAPDDVTLIYVRTATFLRPDHIDALLLSAELLDGLGQYDLAVATYRKVPQESADHHAAELGRAEALRRAAKPDAAIEVLENLAISHPDLPLVHSSLGDLLRQQEDYELAVEAYDRAIELTDASSTSLWFLHYARAISYERIKNWDKAEADFRAALVLNPNQPQVLNYLGYSLVERKEKLDEALKMIELA
ncbi:MAG: tetratricopeptide repeat protein, partial [Arenibacterium sp.]